MEVITAVLQARVSTILIFAGILIVFFTLFNISLSKKTVELRTMNKSNTHIIIIAVVFGAGLILAGLLVNGANKQDSSSSIAPTLVQSITIGSPTPTLFPTKTPSQTPTVSTPTLVPTETPKPTSTFTLTPKPPAIGEDWKSGCISSLWQRYPSNTQSTDMVGCLPQPVDLFSINNGSLGFQYIGNASSADIHGLFAQLPTVGTASLEILLTQLLNGEIWIGVFAEPNIDSAGMLLVIPEGDVTNRLIVERTMPEQKRIDGTQLIISDSAVYKVAFDFTNELIKASSTNARYNFTFVPLVSTEKWLFIGFRAENGFNRITAEFRNLAIPAQ